MTAQMADVAVRQLVADDWAVARGARLAALAEAPYAFASTLAKEQAYDDEVWRSRAGSGRTFGAFDGGDHRRPGDRPSFRRTEPARRN
jgi:hypothetical protein